MKKFFEDRKQKFIKDIYNRNPDVMEKLKEVFGRVLDDMFEEFETSGVSPGSREQFWNRLSKALSDCGCCQYANSNLVSKTAVVYQEMENIFQCWPPQKDMDWRENADYITIQRQDEYFCDKFFTLLLPAEPQSLQTFLCKNGLDKPWDCRILSIHMGGKACVRLQGNLHGCGSVMEINYFFHCFNQLSEKEKHRYVIAAAAEHFETAKTLINLTANMDNLHIVKDIGTAGNLGMFLVENDLTSLHFPDEVLPFLDYEKVAEAHMKETGGWMHLDNYIEEAVPRELWTEIYDGIHLPDFSLEQKAPQETEPEPELETEEAQGFDPGMTL